jgi:Fe-S-cluster containining protein
MMIDFDFSPYFKRYEALVQLADQIFDKMSKAYPDAVTCRIGCADCCYALFDLTLIEALYINDKFNQIYGGPQREALLETANRVDRTLAKIKRQAMHDLRQGKSEDDILLDLARVRVRCPLLDADDRCELYDARPITCRLYGIPTSIGDKGRTCCISGFENGRQYPTVKLDLIHQQLQQISTELIRDLNSEHIKLADLLVPLSMALLTLYDEEYLGVKCDQKTPSTAAPGKK